jgi:hypothetical protein
MDALHEDELSIRRNKRDGTVAVEFTKLHALVERDIGELDARAPARACVRHL